MIYTKSNNSPIGFRVERFDVTSDVHVNIREMLPSDIMYYQSKYKDESNVFDFCCDMVAHGVVDDEGKQIFDDADDLKQNFLVGTSVLYAIQAKIFDLSKVPAKGEDPKN